MKYFSTLIIFLFVISLSAQDQVVIFSDSPDGDYYDASWGFANSPSLLTMAGSGGNKYAVETENTYEGVHSLLLEWTSASGGDWGIAVAADGWTTYNYTLYDSIVYWVNGPATVSQNALPDLCVEDLSNQKSDRVWIGNYIDSVDADVSTWQKVSIPIADIPVGAASFQQIKTIFHFQKNADGIAHTLWLDDIRVIKAGSSGNSDHEPPQNVIATAHDSRVDLQWDAEENINGYNIYGADAIDGPYTRLNTGSHDFHIYSDFIGSNGSERFYYATVVDENNLESVSSDTVSAIPFVMTDDELLTSVQEATFRYFYDYAHPVSGLTRERYGSGNTCTSGGTGFGLMTLVVGVERNFVSREDAAALVLKVLKFMQDDAVRFHGAWPHWINGETGATIPFSQYDDGADIVETAYFIEGALTVRKYFDQDNSTENEIRSVATALWEQVDWAWFRKDPPQGVLYWHWSPNYTFQMNMQIRGFNETMITYLLAIASPTNGVPASLYTSGWTNNSAYVNGKTFYGYKQWVGYDKGGPLFFTHYSFLGFDPHHSDQYCNYFENNKNISLINRAHCTDNPNNYEGYSDFVWGLTASDDPFGYSAHSPTNDNGTITPTAAISAMPYVPEESIATLKHFYSEYGDRIWGPFGFYDAFNLEEDWFTDSYLAIDQGTIVPMIENYRTGLIWDLFMSNEEIQTMVAAIGFTSTAIEEKGPQVTTDFKLYQNYPNPFNPETTISFNLKETSYVRITIYDQLGRKINALINKTLPVGYNQIQFYASNLASGIYFYRLEAFSESGILHFNGTEKMIILR